MVRAVFTFVTIASALVACTDSPRDCPAVGAVSGAHGLCVCPTGMAFDSSGDRCAPLAIVDDGGSLDAASSNRDASGSGELADAHVVDAQLDATQQSPDASLEPDAAQASPDASAADAGSARCDPEGDWQMTFTQQSGDCGQIWPEPFTWGFAGRIQGPLEGCYVDGKATADGCSFTYVQICEDASSNTKLRETGTLSMTSPTTISGLVKEERLSEDETSTLCTGMFQIIGVPKPVR